MSAMGRDLAAETSGAVTKMLDCGVEHRDIRPPNVLWNPEIKNIVLVDFERSEILKQMRFFRRCRPTRSGSTFTLTQRHIVEVFLTDFSSILASASIGAVHMFRWSTAKATFLRLCLPAIM
jgi:serine/threonine protein kinase